MNTNILVETKKEYTIQLVNILTPLIYEGLKAIYEDSVSISEGKNTLLIYQNLLKRIPKWPPNLINDETERIKNQSNCFDWFDNLIKAVIKSNILILSNTNELPKNTVHFYDNINIPNFIHQCYIQCGQEIFNSPYLFYHKLNAVKIKQNQRESCELIKEGIRQAIRKMLPLKHILFEYLNNKLIGGNNSDKILSDKQTISEPKNILGSIDKTNSINNRSSSSIEVKKLKLNLKSFENYISESSNNLIKLKNTTSISNSPSARVLSYKISKRGTSEKNSNKEKTYSNKEKTYFNKEKSYSNKEENQYTDKNDDITYSESSVPYWQNNNENNKFEGIYSNAI
jgi:hypothetical protein